jgi:hypothetical protein
MYELFSTPSELPFLLYKAGDALLGEGEGEIDWGSPDRPSISLHCETRRACEPIPMDELFTVHSLGYFKGLPHPLIVANVLCNEIARQTRRAAGNIVIVPSQLLKEDLEALAPEHCKNWTIIVDDTLQSNEIRATYWKAVSKNHWAGLSTDPSPAVAVDGGIQITPHSFHKLPNWKSYFLRAFV